MDFLKMSERELVGLAQNSDDHTASLAMKELRGRFDNTYFWCSGCDFLVCKKADCCENN